MLLQVDYFDTIVVLFFYLFIYNFSILTIIWKLFNLINSDFKTLYSFSDLKLNTFFLTILAVTLFSMAGVPPFIGFFSKILILLLLINSNFFLMYYFFFGLLFFGLYFYLQNIRFLFTTTNRQMTYAYEFNMRLSIGYYFYSSFFIFIICCGVFFIDDFFLYFYWLFV